MLLPDSFCFSDGVTELMNARDELYGFERIKELLISNTELACNQIRKSLLNDFEKFRGDTPQYDDITFVIIKNNS